MTRPTLTFDCRRFVAQFLWYGMSLLLALSTWGFFSRFHWTADVASDFRVQYTIAFSICSVVFCLLSWRKSAIVAAVFTLLNAAVVVPLYFPGNSHPSAAAVASDRSPLRVLYMNVNFENRQYEKALAVIRELSPDVVAVSELTAEWGTELLQSLSKDYPYYTGEVRVDAFGIGLFS